MPDLERGPAITVHTGGGKIEIRDGHGQCIDCPTKGGGMLSVTFLEGDRPASRMLMCGRCFALGMLNQLTGEESARKALMFLAEPTNYTEEARRSAPLLRNERQPWAVAAEAVVRGASEPGPPAA